MRSVVHTCLALIFFVGGIALPIAALAEDNVVVVIIDGARYSETLGDPNYTYVPKMGRLSEFGTVVEPMLNDRDTWTSRAVPALWSGDWAEPVDTVYNGHSTQYTTTPSMFEYYRKQTGAPETDCYYVLKSISSLWLPSFETDYGPDYWPRMHSVGYTDSDVFEEAKAILQSDQPHLMWVYFADVDHAGHSGDWTSYTCAIEIADSLVNELWSVLQSDPHYRNNTAMIVTNDHGRHLDGVETGFQGHGCSCDGCRTIMFLGVGPSFKERFVSTRQRTIPDIAVTAASLLNVEMPYSSGEVMSELFVESGIPERGQNAGTLPVQLLPVYPNPSNATVSIGVRLSEETGVNLSIRDLLGRQVTTLMQGVRSAGEYRLTWQSGNLPSGTYFVVMDTPAGKSVRRFLLVR